MRDVVDLPASTFGLSSERPRPITAKKQQNTANDRSIRARTAELKRIGLLPVKNLFIDPHTGLFLRLTVKFQWNGNRTVLILKHRKLPKFPNITCDSRSVKVV